jgi:hypothetical protein
MFNYHSSSKLIFFQNGLLTHHSPCISRELQKLRSLLFCRVLLVLLRLNPRPIIVVLTSKYLKRGVVI